MSPTHHLGGPASILVTLCFVILHQIFHFKMDYNVFIFATPVCIRQHIINMLMHVEGRDYQTKKYKLRISKEFRPMNDCEETLGQIAPSPVLCHSNTELAL